MNTGNATRASGGRASASSETQELPKTAEHAINKPALEEAAESLKKALSEARADLGSTVSTLGQSVSDLVPDPIENNALFLARVSSLLFSDFLLFIRRGNVLDLAVGVLIGSAFTGLVNATADDLIAPLLALSSTGPTLSSKMHVLRPGFSGNTTYASFDAAKKDGAVAVFWGHWLSILLHFWMVAPVVYFFARVFAVGEYYKRKREEEEAREREVGMVECAYCLDKVDGRAVKCRACGSWLKGPETYKVVGRVSPGKEGSA